MTSRCSDNVSAIPRARIVDASYKDRSVDEVTTGAWCFLLS